MKWKVVFVCKIKYGWIYWENGIVYVIKNKLISEDFEFC